MQESSPWYIDLSLAKNQLVNGYPPQMQVSCKTPFFSTSRQPLLTTTGNLRIVRARANSKILLGRQSIITSRDGFYDYDIHDNSQKNWFVNFADYSLFGYYATELFAQDEIMVAEIPILASVREFLLSIGKTRGSDFMPQTQDDDELPSPFLIMNADRCLAIDTSEIYGNNLAEASADEIQESINVLSPTVSLNIAAMEAPHPGTDIYKQDEIKDIVVTALTTFNSVVTLSDGAPVRIHTGNWGCGAFGGNKTVMYVLQSVAADWSGANEIVFYDYDPVAMEEALKHLALVRDSSTSIDDLTAYVVAQSFPWGQGNGS